MYSLQENDSNSNKIPEKLLVAKWISQGGMSAFGRLLTMIFVIVAFFCTIGLIFQIIRKPIGIDLNKVVDDFMSSKTTSFFNVFIASIAILIIPFGTVRAFRALQNPTKEISRKFGYDFFLNLSFSPLFILTLMPLFLSKEEIYFLDHIIFIYWIPLLFFLNLILWTITHIALYYKAKSADRESSEQIQT